VNIHYEAVVALGLVGFYLADSACLLRSDEAVMQPGRGSTWRPAFGARQWRLSGKEPWLPNPFTPHRPVYRLRWRMEGGDAPAATGPQLQAAPRLRALAPLVWIAWLALLVGVPLGLLTRAGPPLALACVGLAYLNNIVALVLVHRWRDALALPPQAFGMLAFECLACAPYAINLVRRVSLLAPVAEDLVVAAQRVLTPEQRAVVQRECLLRLDEQLDFEAEGSPRAAALGAGRARVAALATSTPQQAPA
jgi:hypothetical protein